MHGKTSSRAALGLGVAVVFLLGCPPSQTVKDDRPVGNTGTGTGTGTGETGVGMSTGPGTDAVQAITAAAGASLEPRSGSAVSGKATFEQGQKAVRLTVEVRGATPGLHGLHLHEKGDCGGASADAAGEIWNPVGVRYTGPSTSTYPLGDLGNIEIAADGTGKLELISEFLTVSSGDKSVVGRSIIVREKPNDRQTHPSGNSGQRFACGVIQVTPR